MTAKAAKVPCPEPLLIWRHRSKSSWRPWRLGGQPNLAGCEDSPATPSAWSQVRRCSRVRAMSRLMVLVPAALVAGCATMAGKMETLPKAVSAYNELLRWGKLDGAALFRLPEEQATFVARYALAEDDLH